MEEKQEHLDMHSRYVIEHSPDDRMSFHAIAREPGRDNTTISKGIRNHIVFRKTGGYGRPVNDCSHRRFCNVLHICEKCVNRVGRTWEDYTSYMEEHPDIPVVQLDPVEGIRGGKVLLTVHFVGSSFMPAFLRDSNDHQPVINIFDHLYLEVF